MSMQKKILASAIVAGLAMSFNAWAGIQLGDDAMVYASELEDGTELSTGNDVTFAVGYNFSAGEVRYGRYECTENMTLDDVILYPSVDASIELGAINGEGSSGVYFSMTGNGGESAADEITVYSTSTLEDGGDVQCAFSIYDQPSEAQAGGDEGLISTTGWETVIARESGFVFAMDPEGSTEAVADVEAENGPYFDFEGSSHPGNLTFEAAEGVFDKDGDPILLSDIFGDDTEIVVEGDFSAANEDCGFYNHGLDEECWELGDGQASFVVGSNSFSDSFHFDPSGDVAIPKSDYEATLLADANEGYEVGDVGPIHVGRISHNGTELQAPLAQVPAAGWLSRMALTNTGSTDRPYEISVMGEAGNEITTANTTGLVPANGTVVVDLTTVMTGFTAGMQRRGTINVTVAAPNDQIQGLYQIVNQNSNSISNHVMVRPVVDEDEEID